MKFCINCDYCKEIIVGYCQYFHCDSLEIMTTDYVTGKLVPKYNTNCNTIRNDCLKCGPDAKWFKEKLIEEKTEIVPWYKKLFKEN